MSAEGETVIQPEKPHAEKPGVYRLNACEWWAARSLEEAIAAAAERYGVHAAEVLDDLSPPHRMTQEEMDMRHIQDGGMTVPFSLYLEAIMSNGAELPMLIAARQ